MHTPAKPCQVRRATSADAAIVSAFVRDLCAHFGDPPACSKDALLRDWPCFEAYLAVCDGEPVGLLLGHPTYNPRIQARGFEVANLVVDAAMRGRGIGRHLLAAVIEMKAREGTERIALSTFADRPELLAFYEVAGMTRVNTTRLARFRLEVGATR